MAESINPLSDPANLSPSEARGIFHRNGFHGSTSGFCAGYIQANVTIIPSELADDFEELCKRNHSALPLLYRSKPGELKAPPLASNTDIKWDLPRYFVYSSGRIVEDTLDLDGFSSSWENKVSFYLGCSFSFESELMKGGIELHNLKAKSNCSMYKTSLTLEGTGVFTEVPMVTSMRVIPEHLLPTTISIVAQYPDHHGAPIHIGDPLRIGIPDIAKTTYGDSQVVFRDDDIPVFWACGFSVSEAIACTKPKLAFSHYPGSMFIGDIKAAKKPLDGTIKVLQLSRPSAPYFASIIRDKYADIFPKLEQALLSDPGKRGVSHLFVKDDLLKAVLSLSHSKRVAICTGFPCNFDQAINEETDGLPGALSILQALLTLKKEVSLISDESKQDLYKKCVQKMVELGALKSTVPVISFKTAKGMTLTAAPDSPPFDCLLAIERAGQSKDGTYRSMKSVDVSALVDPMDELFVSAQSNQLVTTIGIGDGGNEVGMGKVFDAVSENIPLGKTIACKTSTDFLIAAGISNWAGYAVSLGLYAVSNCPVHWRYARHGINAETTLQLEVSEFLPSDDQTTTLLQYMNDDLGILDGVNQSKGSVDSVPLAGVLELVHDMVDLVKTCV